MGINIDITSPCCFPTHTSTQVPFIGCPFRPFTSLISTVCARRTVPNARKVRSTRTCTVLQQNNRAAKILHRSGCVLSWALLIASKALDLYQIVEHCANWIVSKGRVEVRRKLSARKRQGLRAIKSTGPRWDMDCRTIADNISPPVDWVTPYRTPAARNIQIQSALSPGLPVNN